MKTRYAPVIGATAVVAALLLGFAVSAAGAAAGHPAYQLKNSGAKCRAGYVRQTRHVKTRQQGKSVTVGEVWCVYRSSRLIPTAPDIGAQQYVGKPAYGEPSFFAVFGAVAVAKSGREVLGVPLTVRITDATAHQKVASFTITSSNNRHCAVVYTLENGTLVLIGESVQRLTGDYFVGCPLARVTMPAVDVPEISASFAGNSAYAAGSSHEEGMFHTNTGAPRAPATPGP